MTHPQRLRHGAAFLAALSVCVAPAASWAQATGSRAAPAPVIVTPVVPLSPATAQPPSQVVATNAMGAAPAPSRLLLEVLRPSFPLRLDVASGLVVEGRTAPHALVRARVDAVPPASAGRASVAQVVMEETVQADADGNFRVSLGPQRAPAGTRFEMALRATQGAQSTPEQRLVVLPAQG